MKKEYLCPQTKTTFLMTATLMQGSNDGPNPAGDNEFPDVGAKDMSIDDDYWEE